jgi:Tol biopolymer transport system component
MDMRMMRTRGVRLLFTGAAALAAACADAAGPGAVSRVDVSPAEREMWAGDTLRLTAAVRGAGGGALDEAVAWTTSDASVASVDAAGKVTAVGPGRATLTATAGGRRGEARITVAAYDLLYEQRTPPADAALWILPLTSGGVPRRVFAGGGWASDPTPSPDGTRIAYVVWSAAAGSSDVWVANRDGSSPRRLTDSEEIDDQPAWSPDGARIAYRSFAAGRSADVWIMNADGSGKRQLTQDPLPGVTDEVRPAWSPDGTFIVYSVIVFDEGDLFVIPAAGGAARRLTSGPEHDIEPAWSPDGARIVFCRTSAGDADLASVPAAGGAVERMSVPGSQVLPAWSPDGRLIAYTHSSGTGAPPQLYTARPDGSDRVQRTTDPAWGGGGNAAFIRRPVP